MKTQATQSLIKLGFSSYLDLSDVEQDIGTFFPDSMEPRVRSLIKKETEKSNILRHPFLTGIPTLGIAPRIAKSRALDNISRTLTKEDVEMGKMRQQQQILEALRSMRTLQAINLGNRMI
jgi:hypothetical protein